MARGGIMVAPFLLFLACASPEGAAPVPGRINRIVSLSPSLTRQVVDMGGGELIVGVTSFDGFSRGGCAVVGTLLQPNIERIIVLEPDLVLFSGEDGPVQKLETLKRAGIAFRRFGRNRGFEDICANYLSLGALLGRGRLAGERVAKYRAELRGMARRNRERSARPLAAFFLSCRPLIAASAESFIGGIIADSGGVSAYAGAGMPYPLVSLESLAALDPDVIICMTGEDDLREFAGRLSDFPSMKAVAGGRIHLIDPEIVPYYTPADYVTSVGMVSALLHGAAGEGQSVTARGSGG